MLQFLELLLCVHNRKVFYRHYFIYLLGKYYNNPHVTHETLRRCDLSKDTQLTCGRTNIQMQQSSPGLMLLNCLISAIAGISAGILQESTRKWGLEREALTAGANQQAKEGTLQVSLWNEHAHVCPVPPEMQNVIVKITKE